MNWIDLINGVFVFGGAGYAWANAYKIHKDKQVKGIFISSTIFFTLWSFWSTFYYYSLTQWFSLYCNLFMAVADIVWVVMAIRRCNHGTHHQSDRAEL
jgi:hypothetical protein